MQQAIVTVPKATLYQTIAWQQNRLMGQQVSDELLSGWTVTVQNCQGNYLYVTTNYGYAGWLLQSDLQKLSRQECRKWDSSQSALLLTQRMTDVLAAPKVQASVITTLFMGSHIIPCGCPENGWQRVQLSNGSLGYVPAIAVCPLQTSPYTEQNDAAQDAQSALRSAILDYAVSYLGTPYRWGGKTHQGIDCSGLTFMSYYMCSIPIYRDAAIQPGYPVQEIPFSQIKPADLLYFPGHVALYLGNETYIHATGNMSSFGCVINSLNANSPNYRADLAESLYAAGSIFP